MAFFAIRFDFRNPAIAGVAMADRYAAALDMAEWADRLGAVAVVLSQHHGSADGYLPSPVTMVSAMAARTSTVRFTISAIVGPFQHPLLLAEDLAVLDLLSQGRVDVIITGGYVHSEFAMFDVPLSDRPKLMTELATTLKQAWTGEPFEFRGRTVQVTPAPLTPGGPKLSMGGSSEAAARRAARLADGFMPSEPQFWDFYVDECKNLGKPDPGPWLGGDTSVVFLSHDPDATWSELGQYFLHETNAYGQWQAESGVAGGYHEVSDVETLRGGGQYRVLTPDEYVAELTAAGPFGYALLHPMVGGVPPEAAWECLRLFEQDVLPRLS